MRRLLPVLLFVVTAVTIAGTGMSYLAGSVLSAPATRPIGPAPADLGATDVEFAGIKGWFVPGEKGAPCLLLMHGLRADRRSMIERARFLQQVGYATLLFDFQAHGESSGERITFGYRESSNAQAAVALLRSRFKCSRLAAVGQSLGGAAALLGAKPLDLDALILESVYPSIDEAIATRLKLRLGKAGRLLTPLLTLQLQPRLGVDPEALRPISRIGEFHGPLLVMAGTEDKRTPIEESRRLFIAANEPKEFWAVQGAAHVDLHRFAPAAYRQKLLRFLSKHLGAPTLAGEAQAVEG